MSERECVRCFKDGGYPECDECRGQRWVLLIGTLVLVHFALIVWALFEVLTL